MGVQEVPKFRPEEDRTFTKSAHQPFLHFFFLCLPLSGKVYADGSAVKSPAALPENLGVSPRIHTAAYSLSLQGPPLASTNIACVWHRHMHAGKTPLHTK